MNNSNYARWNNMPKGCARVGDRVLYSEDDDTNTNGYTDVSPCTETNKCIGWTLYGDSVEPGEDYIPELGDGGGYAPHGPIIEYSQKGGSKHYTANDCIIY